MGKRYKIISRRSSITGRAITYEIDGKIREVSAPNCAASFDDLERLIEKECDAKAQAGTTVEPPKTEEPPFDVDETTKDGAKETTTTTKRGRKSKESK